MIGLPLPPAVQETQETQVRSLGWKSPLEEGMATHASILAWRFHALVYRGVQRATVHRVAKSWTQLSRRAAFNDSRLIETEKNDII